MTVDCEEITIERLETWGAVLAEHHGTPAILIGVGHDDVRGRLHMSTTEDMTVDMVRAILAKVLMQLMGDQVEVFDGESEYEELEP